MNLDEVREEAERVIELANDDQYVGGQDLAQLVMQLLSDFPETHRSGHLSIENDEIVRSMDLTDCDVGVQVSHDGRIWLCVNGTAWVRFKPSRVA